ncbi:transposase [Bradyrhizobium sp. USDA 4506]
MVDLESQEIRKSAGRRSLTDDYERQAVELVAWSGRSIASVAKEPGKRDAVLRRWVAQRGRADDEAPHNAGEPAVGGPRARDRTFERTSGCAWTTTI